MKMLNNRLIFNFCTGLSRYLKPFNLNITKSQQIPTLRLKPEKQLIKNWWSESPFQGNKDLNIPVFSFTSNEYTGQSVDIPSQIFNQPLRRDLIYRLYNFRINLDKFSTVKTRNRAETAGSGAKMRAQKKSGRARMGDKRAPHLKKGGKAHGRKPKIFSFTLNAKIKLKALQALLSSKMAQGKIKIINQQSIPQPKTKFIMSAIRKHEEDSRALFCVITSVNADQNFQYGRKNISQVLWHDSYNLDVNSLFIADKILFTLKGLQQFINNMRKTKYTIFRQAHQSKGVAQSKEVVQQIRWNPEQPYQFKFRILAQYLQQYERVKNETPELLQKQEQRINKIEI